MLCCFKISKIVLENPHFGFSGVPLMNTMTGQLDKMLLILGSQIFFSLSKFSL